MVETVLAVAVTIYGVAGALGSLLQLRCMWRRRSAEDVSLAYLFIATGGYVLWLAYRVARGDLPLVLVAAVGGIAIAATTVAASILRARPERFLASSVARAPGVGRGESRSRPGRHGMRRRAPVPVTRFRTRSDYLARRGGSFRMRSR
jgi:uncharacterized protein with PQ loop repeat